MINTFHTPPGYPAFTFPNMTTLVHTPVAEIPGIVQQLREVFLTGKTRDVAYRKKQLKQFAYMMKENADAFADAINKDLGRPATETLFGEVFTISNEIIETIDNLDKWTRDGRPGTDLAFLLHTSRVRNCLLYTSDAAEE